jgi:transcriptional regulator with XRE-family HTH domain
MATTRASRAITDWLRSGTEEDPHTQEILVARVSARVGRTVSQSTISLIARGQQQPRADLVAAFLVELGIEVEWWLPDQAESGSLPTPGSATGTDDS